MLAKRTAALWIVWFCINFSYYGAFIWIPSLLHAQGYTLVKSFSFTLIITLAQLPGYAVSALLIERWGRRPTLALFLVGSAVSAAGFGLAAAPWQIILAGCLLSFFSLGAWGCVVCDWAGALPYSPARNGHGCGSWFRAYRFDHRTAGGATIVGFRWAGNVVRRVWGGLRCGGGGGVHLAGTTGQGAV